MERNEKYYFRFLRFAIVMTRRKRNIFVKLNPGDKFNVGSGFELVGSELVSLEKFLLVSLIRK